MLTAEEVARLRAILVPTKHHPHHAASEQQEQQQEQQQHQTGVNIESDNRDTLECKKSQTRHGLVDVVVEGWQKHCKKKKHKPTKGVKARGLLKDDEGMKKAELLRAIAEVEEMHAEDQAALLRATERASRRQVKLCKKLASRRGRAERRLAKTSNSSLRKKIFRKLSRRESKYDAKIAAAKRELEKAQARLLDEISYTTEKRVELHCALSSLPRVSRSKRQETFLSSEQGSDKEPEVTMTMSPEADPAPTGGFSQTTPSSEREPSEALAAGDDYETQPLPVAAERILADAPSGHVACLFIESQLLEEEGLLPSLQTAADGGAKTSPSALTELLCLLVQWTCMYSLLHGEARYSTEHTDSDKKRIVFLCASGTQSSRVLLFWASCCRAEHALIAPLFTVQVVAATPTAPKYAEQMKSTVADAVRRLQLSPAHCAGLWRTRECHRALVSVGVPAASLTRTPAELRALLPPAPLPLPSSSLERASPAEWCRSHLFASLCKWCGLAKRMQQETRRPEVAVAVVRARARLHLRWGLVRPPYQQSSVFGQCGVREALRVPQGPLACLSRPRRQALYKCLECIFTRAVVCTATDMLRAYGDGCFTKVSCLAASGYLCFSLEAALRCRARVSIVADLHTSVSGQVLRSAQCSCNPRPFERVPFTETGEKRCRHMAVLLLYLLEHCIVWLD